jgi:hypothetical protein
MTNRFRSRINRLERRKTPSLPLVSIKDRFETEEDWEEARQDLLRARKDPNIIFKDYAGIARHFGMTDEDE